MKKVYVLGNRYMDSVTLMGVGIKLTDLEGVNGAECGMGTPQNMELLAEEGYQVPEGTTKNDLMLAIDAVDEEKLNAAYQAGMEALSGGGGKHKRVYRDVDELEPGAFDVVQISLPGQYAIKEAKIREAEGEAEAIRSVQRALADSIKMLNEASPSERVIALKSLEAFEKAADGKATKIIIPSEIQSVAGLATSLKELLTAPQAVPEEVPAPEKPFGCVKDDRPQYPDN